MSYVIECNDCRKPTTAQNIVALFDQHTNRNGRFICKHCQGTDTFIHKKSNLQEPGQVWNRWIKGAIRLKSHSKTYSPYIFLTAKSKNANPGGLHFHYYKDTRAQGGKLKHGHGPGGPPVLDMDNLFEIMKHLVSEGIVTKAQVVSFASKL